MTDPTRRSQTGFRLGALGDARGHVSLAGAWQLRGPCPPWHQQESWVRRLVQHSCGQGSLHAQSCSLEDAGAQAKSSLFPATRMQSSPDGAAIWGAVLGMLCAPLLRAGVPKTPVGSLGITLALVQRLGSCSGALGCWWPLF